MIPLSYFQTRGLELVVEGEWAVVRPKQKRNGVRSHLDAVESAAEGEPLTLNEVDEIVHTVRKQRGRAWPQIAESQNDPLVAETEAFLAMHSELVKAYLGEHVAIYQGELVDHDRDVVALMLRTREKYGSGRVLLREVETEPDRVLRVPSFRFVHE